VSALAPRSSGARGWDVTTAAGDTEAYDFAVVATGGYSAPMVPALPGAESFAGTVQHSTAFTDAAAVKGKHVVVLGGAKSALDCAVAAAQAGAASTTLVSRVRWSARARRRAAHAPAPSSRRPLHPPTSTCRQRTGARPARSPASYPFSLSF
jgi:cation diffusion facilitator CzcD-associated flavoprotein CzcO